MNCDALFHCQLCPNNTKTLTNTHSTNTSNQNAICVYKLITKITLIFNDGKKALDPEEAFTKYNFALDKCLNFIEIHMSEEHNIYSSYIIDFLKSKGIPITTKIIFLYSLNIINDIQIPKSNATLDRFFCDLCENKSYADRGGLKRHNLLKHKYAKRNTCSICDASFFLESRLTMHYDQDHKNDITKKCKICLKQFKRNYLLQEHFDEHPKKFICEICRKLFGTRQHKRRHFKSCKSKNNK